MKKPPLAQDPIREATRNWERHGWGDVARPMAAITSIMRAQQILLGRTQAALKPYGLTFARYELLALLNFSREKRMRMSKASALLQVHPTSVTNAVDRLEAAGLVERTPHESDRRALVLALTDEGRRVAVAATETLNAEVFGRSGFDPADVDTLIDVLGRFRAEAGDFEADGLDADAPATAERTSS
ncbi:MarR family transcriptional regulator [Micrococcus yunnanensis]|uniref:MarR family winged helix-turn-helix transcriptional regulator n=1 Tax=Micrococcus TaxID=1269 RepID=UPI000BF64C10|nr:MarR family transcriptional regulator [Micrococcus luteus]PFH06523.1 DNA-binding MarR family transcriptional regulator [Micrococcaceae bacterium JKS001869]MBU8743483.1 MarR family transcriptional regulator [Micrococcus luteus]MCV7595289.1 MarR family transcriptional regulator [Micrococcus luteus]MCV7718367.1 MarR family transcriptional regulator [Micrococcus luteus]MCV7720575.1 MarR family transcriptional regulator [Micrococcus luteus]